MIWYFTFNGNLIEKGMWAAQPLLSSGGSGWVWRLELRKQQSWAALIRRWSQGASKGEEIRAQPDILLPTSVKRFHAHTNKQAEAYPAALWSLTWDHSQVCGRTTVQTCKPYPQWDSILLTAVVLWSETAWLEFTLHCKPTVALHHISYKERKWLWQEQCFLNFERNLVI